MLKLRLSPSLLLTAPLALLAPVATRSQSPQPSPTLSTTTNVVLVPALVTNREGGSVFSLTADSFTVSDDGVPQKLTLEADTDREPIALAVVIQTGGAAAQRLDRYHTLPILIGGMIGEVPHHTALITFDSTPHLALDFSPDSQNSNPVRPASAGTPNSPDSTADPNDAPLTEAIHDLRGGDQGNAILDTLGYAVDLLRTQPSTYRRAILLVSETLDGGSRLKLDDALRAISDTNTTIYSLGFTSIRSHAMEQSSLALNNPNPGPKGGCMANEKAQAVDDSQPGAGQAPDFVSENSDADDPNSKNSGSKHPKHPKRTAKELTNQAYDCLGVLAPPFALAKIAFRAAANGLRRNVPETVASLTGGEYYSFKNPKDIERDMTTIANHVPNRYILSFHPQDPHPGLHSLSVHLKDYPKLELYARTSYWADSIPSAQP